MNIKYTDEIIHDKQLGFQVKIRHLDSLMPEMEQMLEEISDLKKLNSYLTSDDQGHHARAAQLIEKLIGPLHSMGSREDMAEKLKDKVKAMEKKHNEYFGKDDLDDFFNEITDGRYPSYLTLNHSGSADMYDQIKGGICVCTYKNMFWRGTQKIYLFSNKNSKFKDYLKEIREAAEKTESKDFFKGLPLEATKEQLVEYLNNNKDSSIGLGEAKNPDEMKKKHGHDYVIHPAFPLGLTRINGKVKKDSNMGELLIACFMGGAKIHEEEEKNGQNVHTFKGVYNGRDNLEALTVLYSGMPYSGLGDWGGRLEFQKSQVAPEIYKEFNYRFGDISELVVDLGRREVRFFNV